MKRLIFGAAVAGVLLSALLLAQPGGNPLCETLITATLNGAGVLTFNTANTMRCGLSDTMTVSFQNNDKNPHRFQISDISCKNDPNGVGNNPAKGFLRQTVEVDPGQTEILKHGWWVFKSRPNVGSMDEVKKVSCTDTSGTVNYLYKYTVRVSDSNGDGHAASYDPDLEVSPPPSLVAK